MALTGTVKLISSLTRSGSSAGQSDSVVNSIRLCLEDAGHRVGDAAIEYEDLDDGTPEHGSWLPELERENARAAAADPDVVAYIETLDADAAPHSLPILNAAGPLVMISPCNTYPGLTKPVRGRPTSPTCTTRPGSAAPRGPRSPMTMSPSPMRRRPTTRVARPLNAIERAGTKDRAAVTRELLATRDHDGLLGRWSFDANGDITLRRTSRLTVEGGDFAFLAHFDLPR